MSVKDAASQYLSNTLRSLGQVLLAVAVLAFVFALAGGENAADVRRAIANISQGLLFGAHQTTASGRPVQPVRRYTPPRGASAAPDPEEAAPPPRQAPQATRPASQPPVSAANIVHRQPTAYAAARRAPPCVTPVTINCDPLFPSRTSPQMRPPPPPTPPYGPQILRSPQASPYAPQPQRLAPPQPAPPMLRPPQGPAYAPQMRQQPPQPQLQMRPQTPPQALQRPQTPPQALQRPQAQPYAPQPRQHPPQARRAPQSLPYAPGSQPPPQMRPQQPQAPLYAPQTPQQPQDRRPLPQAPRQMRPQPQTQPQMRRAAAPVIADPAQWRRAFEAAVGAQGFALPAEAQWADYVADYWRVMIERWPYRLETPYFCVDSRGRRVLITHQNGAPPRCGPVRREQGRVLNLDALPRASSVTPPGQYPRH